MRRLRVGHPPKRSILATLLLLHASYLLLRNPRIENRSASERVVVYKRALQAFWREVLMDGHIPARKEDAPAQLLKTWVSLLLKSQGTSWITSDNPVLLMSIGKEAHGMIFLPINPDWALLAYRPGATTLRSTRITARDTEFLNSYSIVNARRHVFDHTPFEPDDVLRVAKWAKLRPRLQSWHSDDALHLETIRYPARSLELSLLQPLVSD